MLETRDRILSPTGESLVSPYEAAKRLFREGLTEEVRQSLRVPTGRDTSKLLTYYGIDLGAELTDEIPAPDTQYTQEEYDAFMDAILSETVIPLDTDKDEHYRRLVTELEYFTKQDSGIRLLLDINQMINRFYEDGIVWGGRGSSCASYVLYIMGVHFINPIKYDIPFYEFSKEF